MLYFIGFFGQRSSGSWSAAYGYADAKTVGDYAVWQHKRSMGEKIEKSRKQKAVALQRRNLKL